MSAKLTWRALDEAGEARTVANRRAIVPQTLTFLASTLSSPYHLPQERYNCLEPVSKKEIPVDGSRGTVASPSITAGVRRTPSPQ